MLKIISAVSITFLLAAVSPAADWTSILPDASLTGWTRVPIPGSSVLKPYNQWTLDGDELVCRGDGERDWLRFDEVLGDFVLRVEWNATARDGKYNSGVGVRLSPYVEIWHQAQTTPDGGYLFGNTFRNGYLERVNLKKEMAENRVKPAGEWNLYEIRCQGDTIELSVNGKVVNTWKGVEVLRGHIGLEAEGYKIRFRNIQLKRLD